MAKNLAGHIFSHSSLSINHFQKLLAKIAMQKNISVSQTIGLFAQIFCKKSFHFPPNWLKIGPM